ncbi:MAG: hypothetical protein ACTIAJ_18670, partial [Cellulosimicrobium funkei]
MSTPAARPSSGTSDPAAAPDRPTTTSTGTPTDTGTGTVPGPGALPRTPLDHLPLPLDGAFVDR